MNRLRTLVGCLLLVGSLAAPALARPASGSGVAAARSQAAGGAPTEQETFASPHATSEQAAQRAMAPAHESRVAGQEHETESAAEAGEQEHEAAPWAEVVYRWVNFLLLVGLLYWLLVVPPPFVVENFEFPGLRVALAERARAIVASRDLARQQLAEADKSLRESEQRLAQVEQEAAALVREAERAAAAERERLEAAAVAEAERIREGAARDLNAQVAAARRELRQHVANLTTAMARALLERDFGPGDQERLVRGYLARLSHTVA